MTFPPEAYLDLEKTAHARLFEGVSEVWEALPGIGAYVAGEVARIAPGERIRGNVHERAEIGPEVYVEPDATIEAFAVIKGPAWIGAGTTIRSGAYLRENIVVGEGCTLGNSSEFKNCLLFDDCEVPHFNYVGDSILGHRAHLGAGVICSNVRLDRVPVKVRPEGLGSIDTGLRKFGAIIGDRTEVGCNTVFSPGTILGRDCLVYPCTSWSGVLPDNRIVKNRSQITVVERRD